MFQGKFESWKPLTMTLQLWFCQSYCDISWWVVLCLNWYFPVNIRIYFVHFKYMYKDISNRKYRHIVKYNLMFYGIEIIVADVSK